MRVYLCFLFVLLSACGPTTDPALAGGELAAAVKKAKEQGQSSTVLMSYIERATDGELEPVLERSSVALLTPLESSLQVTRDHIITWQRFRVERWLRQLPIDEQCNLRMPSAISAAADVFAPFLRGTAVVDRVTVREVTMEHILFEPSRRYLMFVKRCEANGITVPHLEYGAFYVNDAGRISLPAFNNGNTPYVRQVLELGTIQALEDRLSQLPPV